MVREIGTTTHKNSFKTHSVSLTREEIRPECRILSQRDIDPRFYDGLFYPNLKQLLGEIACWISLSGAAQ